MSLARRGQTRRELGEIVRLMQPSSASRQSRGRPGRSTPDEIVDRAARRHAADELPRVAERDAAVHAARALLAELGLRQMVVKLVPVANRAAGERRAEARRYSKKPVGLPMGRKRVEVGVNH